MFDDDSRPSQYVITHGRTREEAEDNAMRAGEGNIVLVQTVRPLNSGTGGWVARGEVLLP